jgi:glutathione S-transferase
MAKPVIYGPAYSTFARTVRLALEEKGADYDLVEVDILSGQHKEPAHLARHPFGKVPVFEHDGLVLYDTDAITRYINSAFEGPDLEPANARDQALMTQAIGVMNAYGYPCMIGQIFMQRAVMPLLGETSDEAAIEAAMPDAQTCLAALEEMIGDRAFFGGDRLSRADLLLAPVYDYLSQTPEGEKLLAGTPNLRRWWDSLATRPSVEKTRPSLG